MSTFAGQALEQGAETSAGHTPAAAVLVANVLDVLVAEMADRREDGVGRRLPEAAERGVLDHFAQFDESLDVGLFAAPFADAVEDFQHPLCAHAAGNALAARFLADELDEVAGDVDHATGFVHDDQPARAHDRAEFGERLVVQADVEVMLGDAAAGGAADLRGLELLARRGPPANVVDQVAQGHADGDFHEAGVLDRPGQGEDLGALALFRAEGGVPRPAAEEDRGDVGVGLDVVQQRRLAPESLHGGERGAGAGLAPIALDRGHQGRLFAADERPGAHADLEVEVESAAEDVLAEESALAGLVDRGAEPLDRQGILRADVDVAPRRPDRVRRGGHALDDAVRIALEDAAVHERAGVAFVGVADGELLLAGGLPRELPLPPRGESRPAAAAQPGSPHRLDHRLRVVLREDLGQGLVAVAGDVVFDPLGIDDAAVAQDDFFLPLEEVDVGGVGDVPAVGPLVRQPLDDPPLEQVLADDLAAVARLEVLVEDVVDDQHRPGGARAEAARAGDGDPLGQSGPGQLGFDGFFQPRRAGGDAPGAHAELDPLAAGGRPRGLLAADRVAKLVQLPDVGENFRHTPSPLASPVSGRR